MIQLLILLILANKSDVIHYRPVHLMDTPGLSCGAGPRFLKEKVKVELGKHTVKVNRMEWDYQGDVDGYFIAQYKAAPDAHMSMQLDFSTEDAYLSISGIDAKGRPCLDTVYLKRVK